MTRTAFARPGKRAAIAGGLLLALLVVALAGAGWFYSSLLKNGVLLPDLVQRCAAEFPTRWT